VVRLGRPCHRNGVSEVSHVVRVPRVVPYRVARAFAVAVTVVVWAGILAAVGWIFGAMLARPVVSVLAVQLSLGLVIPMVALFSAHGVLTGMVDAYTQGRFTSPMAMPRVAPVGRNPWHAGALAALVVGVPVAGLASLLVARGQAPMGGLSADAYVAVLGGVGLGTSAIVAWWKSGKPLVRLVAAADAGWRYPSGARPYLLRHHVAPHGAANAWINGWVAVALTPATGWAPMSLVVGDAFVAGAVVAAAVSFGARNHARSDMRAGLAAWPPARSRFVSRAAQAGWVVVAGGGAAAFAWGVLAAGFNGGLPLAAFVILKGGSAGGLACLAAWLGARWGLQDGVPERRSAPTAPTAQGGQADGATGPS
jgi:hypothetical protein